MHLQFIVDLFLLAYSAFTANNFYGINISSFNARGQCRSAGPCAHLDTMIVTEVDPPQPLAEWDSIVANAKQNGYKRFRIYGNDCGTYRAILGSGISIHRFCAGTTFDLATAAAKKHGLPVLIGIWVGKFASAESPSYFY